MVGESNPYKKQVLIKPKNMDLQLRPNVMPFLTFLKLRFTSKHVPNLP